ncbi:MAG: hypothetical protein OXF41_03815 [bacterium]|nr:hypothetical protein [bacterium]
MSGVLARTGLHLNPRSAACVIARRVLYGVEPDGFGVPALVDRHRRVCLACQAATVRQRRLLRELAALRHELEPLPYDMTTVLEHPHSVTHPGPARRVWGNRAGAAVASVAAIGVLVLAGRRIRWLVGSR